jgi:hypothetical protein
VLGGRPLVDAPLAALLVAEVLDGVGDVDELAVDAGVLELRARPSPNTACVAPL